MPFIRYKWPYLNNGYGYVHSIESMSPGFQNHIVPTLISARDLMICLSSDQMHQICHEARQGNFLSKIQRTVDGVVLESRDERDEDCVITFQTESILEKFLLKFERLQMDCNDHLYIYDGAHVAGPWRVRLVTDHVL